MTLVAAQVALSVLLLVGAGLLGRTVGNLRDIQLGFDPDRILTLSMDPHLHGIERERLAVFARELEQRAAGIRGVRAAGVISPAPLGSSYFTASVYRSMAVSATTFMCSLTAGVPTRLRNGPAQTLAKAATRWTFRRSP